MNKNLFLGLVAGAFTLVLILFLMSINLAEKEITSPFADE